LAALHGLLTPKGGEETGLAQQLRKQLDLSCFVLGA
jgi:hypothetical protein